MKTLRRTIYPEVKILDEARGIVEYVASDQTVDLYREVILANGWRFTHFAKNSPFIDSHNYSSVAFILGSVLDFEIKNKRLIETVQWAIDAPSNTLAIAGFEMVKAGHLKAVSVGFYPSARLTRWSTGKDFDAYTAMLGKLGLNGEDGSTVPDVIYTEQEQVELSSVIIGANPNALARIAKAYKAGVITDAQLNYISEQCEEARLSGSETEIRQDRAHSDAGARSPLFQRAVRGRLQTMIEDM